MDGSVTHRRFRDGVGTLKRHIESRKSMSDGDDGLGQPGIAIMPRLLAVEVLLAEPEALQDDGLESSLYVLRDRLRGAGK